MNSGASVVVASRGSRSENPADTQARRRRSLLHQVGVNPARELRVHKARSPLTVVLVLGTAGRRGAVARQWPSSVELGRLNG